MAPRDPNQQPTDTGEAEKTVFDNLGMTPDELGANDLDSDTGSDGTDDDTDRGGVLTARRPGADTGDDTDEAPHRRGPPEVRDQSGLDDLSDKRVTHTGKGARPPRKPIPTGAEVRPDGNGNLVDAQGKVVARRGAEARFYMDAHKAKRQVTSLQASQQDVTSRLHRAVELGTNAFNRIAEMEAEQKTIRDLGLGPQEHLEAVQFAAEAKTNPLAVLKKLLTRAAANGIDLTQLGVQNTGGFDAASLMDMVKAEIAKGMNPLTERSQREAQQTRQQQEYRQGVERTKRVVSQFFAQNPEAVPYGPVFKAVAEQPQFAGMTLGEVWAKIQLHLMRRGRPQQRGSSNRGPAPRMPNGRGGGMGNGRTQPNAIASPDTSYESIIRDVMTSAGMRQARR